MKSKDNIVLTIFILLTLFLTITTFVNAYSASNLKAYYAMEDTNLSQMLDSTGNYNLYKANSNNVSNTAGITGYARRWDFTGSCTLTGYNGSIYNLNKKDFSINLWYNETYNTACNRLFAFGNTSAETSPTTFSYTYFNVVSYRDGFGIKANSGAYSFGNKLKMITYTFNNATKNLTIYIDGVFSSSTVITDNPTNSIYLTIGALNGDAIDEVSIWNETLTATDASNLFSRKSYNDVIASTTEAFTYSIYPYSDNFYRAVDTNIVDNRVVQTTDICTVTLPVWPYVEIIIDCKYMNWYLNADTAVGGTSQVESVTTKTTCAINGQPINCQYQETAGILSVYPSSSEAGLSYGTLIYKINASIASGYTQTICNYTGGDTLAHPQYNLTFDSCANATVCGITTGTTEYYSDVFDSGNGRQLILNSTGNRSYSMSALIDTNFKAFRTTFEYRPWINTETIFTLNDRYNANILNVYVNRDSLTTACVYSTTTQYNSTSKTLLYCFNNYTGAKPLSIVITYAPSDAKYYVITENEEDTTIKKSNAVNTISALNPTYFIYNVVTAQPYSYFDNFAQYAYTTQVTLTATNIPSYPQCTYNIGSTYKTRIYFSSNPFDYTNYVDFNVNGISYAQAQLDIISGSSSTSTDVFIKNPITKKSSNMTVEELYAIYATVIILVLALGTAVVIGWATRGSEKAGAVAFLSFLFVVLAGLTFFGIIGWISTIFAILVGLLDTMFIVIGFKMLFFSTSG